MNRFSNDIGAVDEMLPSVLMDCLQVIKNLLSYTLFILYTDELFNVFSTDGNAIFGNYFCYWICEYLSYNAYDNHWNNIILY